MAKRGRTEGERFSNRLLVAAGLAMLILFVGMLVFSSIVNAPLRELANPNLTALSGETASFLAGGEIPIPVVQGGTGVNSVSITYKEYGVKLDFEPTVIDSGIINLRVVPEEARGFSPYVTGAGRYGVSPGRGMATSPPASMARALTGMPSSRSRPRRPSCAHARVAWRGSSAASTVTAAGLPLLRPSSRQNS